MPEFLPVFSEEQAVSLFSAESIAELSVRNTSREGGDFREAIFVRFTSGNRLVIKLAQNAFTDPERIGMWRRCAGEYRRLGFYCPEILPALSGEFPALLYKGHSCFAYAEEFARYASADRCPNARPFRDELYRMTALIAAQKFQYTDLPSAYCLFDTFGDDETDEVMENALEFRRYSRTLPERFSKQADRIFARWEENRAGLEKRYAKLPTSVFQADLNDTNVLLDEQGRFAGIYDFNLAGKDVFLNYLFREIYEGSLAEERNAILAALQVCAGVYRFSDAEKEAALPLYRCLKPLWFTRVEALKDAGTDETAIQKCLDEMERAQTQDIDFRGAMEQPQPADSCRG